MRIPTDRFRTTVLVLAATTAAMTTACEFREPGASDVDFAFGSTGLGPGQFSYPRAIAVSPKDGCVFVVDKTARIQRFSADGEYQHQWRMPEYANGKPVGLFVDPGGRVWVPDTHYARVIVYDRDGNELFRFGERGEDPGQFIFPTSIALDPEGNIYVGEYGGNDRINKFTKDREYLFSFADAASGEGAVARPTQIIIDEDQVIWVADACHHRIARYDLNGKFLSSFGSLGSGDGQLMYPYGMALEGSDSLVVVDQGNNRIVRFDRDGKFLESWGSPGRAIGQVRKPWDLAKAADGRIYALDSWNNRVQVLDW